MNSIIKSFSEHGTFVQPDTLDYILSKERVTGSHSYIVRGEDTSTECPICRKNIEENEQLAICPFCSNNFHMNHFEETLKVTGKCPVCQQSIIHGNNNARWE